MWRSVCPKPLPSALELSSTQSRSIVLMQIPRVYMITTPSATACSACHALSKIETSDNVALRLAVGNEIEAFSSCDVIISPITSNEGAEMSSPCRVAVKVPLLIFALDLTK